VLEKSLKQLQPDLIALIQKLIDGLEHSHVACVLLDHLQKPYAESSLLLPVSFFPWTIVMFFFINFIV
jgi:hypothetical protein